MKQQWLYHSAIPQSCKLRTNIIILNFLLLSLLLSWLKTLVGSLGVVLFETTKIKLVMSLGTALSCTLLPMPVLYWWQVNSTNHAWFALHQFPWKLTRNVHIFGTSNLVSCRSQATRMGSWNWEAVRAQVPGVNNKIVYQLLGKHHNNAS